MWEPVYNVMHIIYTNLPMYIFGYSIVCMDIGLFNYQLVIAVLIVHKKNPKLVTWWVNTLVTILIIYVRKDYNLTSVTWIELVIST